MNVCTLLKKVSAVVLASVFACTMLWFAAPETADRAAAAAESRIVRPTGDAEYRDGEVLITFEDKVSEKTAAHVADQNDGKLVKTATLGSGGSAQTVAAVDTGKARLGAAMEDFARDSRVERVQPNYIYRTSAVKKTRSCLDPLSSKQWQLEAVDAEGAWKAIDDHYAGGGIEKVKVAVLDSGVDNINPDLRINLKKCMNTGGDGDIYDTSTKDIESDKGHGTHVAGIIGADSNGSGVTGVASGKNNDYIDMISICVFTENESGGIGADDCDIIDGIHHAVAEGARVINMSFGCGAQNDKDMEDAVNEATAAGVTVVCAAGNEGGDFVADWPAACRNSISVINCDPYLMTNDESSYGSTCDIAAPGTDIYSTIRSDYSPRGSRTKPGYGYMSGSSMASPQVAAAAALLYVADPELTPAEVKNILEKTSRDMYQSGWDKYSGYGCVNAGAAVRYALGSGKRAAAATGTYMRHTSTNYHSTIIRWNKMWKKVYFSGMAGSPRCYSIYRKENTPWPYYSYQATARGTDIRLNGLKTGARYRYRVSAEWISPMSGEANGSIMGEVAVSPSVGTASLTARALRGQRKVSCRWKKVPGATGYALYRAYKANGKYRRIKVSGKNGRLWTSARMKKGRRYYFKMSAFRRVGKKNIYGPWSHIRGVTVK